MTVAEFNTLDTFYITGLIYSQVPVLGGHIGSTVG